jgi:Uma2 family endonuclease
MIRTARCYDGLIVNAMVAAADIKLRPLKRAEYDFLVSDGAFAGERLELISGMIVEKSPQDAPHASAIERLTMFLVPRLLGRADVRVQLPLAVSDDSEPEPDVAVVALGDYRDAHPKTALLVIEVANSRLDFDRNTKAALYARAGVREYWIVNLIENRVEVHSKPIHSQPGGSAYTEVKTVTDGALAIEGVDVPVAEIL